jgi:DNA repair protein RadC
MKEKLPSIERSFEEGAPSRAAESFALAHLRRLLSVEGPESFGDSELLALVLGRGDNSQSPVAFSAKLLEHLGGALHLSRLRVPVLKGLPGIGQSQAARLVAAFELGKRVARDAARVPPPLPLTSERVISWARARLASLEHEEVWVLCVDQRSSLRSTYQVGRGGMHGCALMACDVLTPVVRDGASGFILVHNHPSGDPTPSPEDIDLTRALSAAATTICVPLLDHVVVGREGGRSFFDLGLLG